MRALCGKHAKSFSKVSVTAGSVSVQVNTTFKTNPSGELLLIHILLKKWSFLCIYDGRLWAKNRQVGKRPEVTGVLVEEAEKFLDESEACVQIYEGKRGGLCQGRSTDVQMLYILPPTGRKLNLS